MSAGRSSRFTVHILRTGRKRFIIASTMWLYITTIVHFGRPQKFWTQGTLLLDQEKMFQYPWKFGAIFRRRSGRAQRATWANPTCVGYRTRFKRSSRIDKILWWLRHQCEKQSRESSRAREWISLPQKMDCMRAKVTASHQKDLQYSCQLFTSVSLKQLSHV